MSDPDSPRPGRPTPRAAVPTRVPRLRRRGAKWCLLAAGALLLITAAWIAVTGLLARRELGRAQADVARLRAAVSVGDLPSARAAAAGLRAHAHRAHQLTTGPGWALAAQLPAAGTPLRTARTITAGLDTLATDAVPQLLTAGTQLQPSTLRRADGSIDVARLAAARPALHAAANQIDALSARVARLTERGWLPAVNAARSKLDSELSTLSRQLGVADLAAHLGPVMLGADRPRRYFVAFQNDAEARGTGGLPGAFAIVTADAGKLRVTQVNSDSVLAGTTARVDFGADYRQLYNGAGTTTLYGNGNLSPHFPYPAQIWASMWQQYSGQTVDGVVAVDPTTLSYLLAVTGPATLPDGTTIGADTIVSLTQSTIYQRYADDDQARKNYLLTVARAVSDRVLAAHADLPQLLRAAGHAVTERRLLLWSTQPSVEHDLAATPLSGVIPQTAAPYVGLSIVNDGGNKLDYYLDRSLTWHRTGCGPTRDVTATIRLTNNAPASGLPKDVTHRSDAHGYPITPGDNRLEVSYYATTGALMSSVTIDGVPATARIGTERDHPVYVIDLELPHGVTRTVVLHLHEPAGTGPPAVLHQPLVRPLTLTIDDARCH